MDIGHYRTQTLVHLFRGPFETHTILRHLETRGCHTAGIGCLTRAIEDLRTLEQRNRFRSRRHVSTFRHAETAVLKQVLCIGFLNLVLCRTRHRDVARYLPRTLAGKILCLRILGHIFLDTSATDVLEFKHIRHLLFVQALRIIDESVRVTERQHFGTETHCFLCRKLGYITGS